jgi:inorganic triphosphatase YgiF
MTEREVRLLRLVEMLKDRDQSKLAGIASEMAEAEIRIANLKRRRIESSLSVDEVLESNSAAKFAQLIDQHLRREMIKLAEVHARYGAAEQNLRMSFGRWQALTGVLNEGG